MGMPDIFRLLSKEPLAKGGMFCYNMEKSAKA